MATAIILGLGVSAASAQPSSRQPVKHPMGVNAREARQAARIKDARQDGELTKGELDRLRADEAAIRAKERVYRESGKGLDSAEYKDLEQSLDRTSKEIYRLAHNGREPGDGK
jgi:hypothetical protein